MKHLEKTYQERFEDLIRSNKERKLKLANEAGFSTVEGYKDFLVSSIQGVEVVKPITTDKPKIHIVELLDNSGSMLGSKFDNAYEGIQNEIKKLKLISEVEYTYSLFNFEDIVTPNCILYNTPINSVTIPKIRCNTGTPLYATIEFIASYLLKESTNEKILVKIFTDGRDEHSRDRKKGAIKSINEMQKAGITITFVGTEQDVRIITQELNIDSSNTLVHDNTARGVEKSFMTTMDATVAYTQSVVRGEDVLTGFYKKEGKL